MKYLTNTNTIKQYIKDAIIKWYITEYSDSTSHVIYHESLEKIENIHCSLIDSPFGKLFHFQASPSIAESKKSIFLRLDVEDFEIDEKNIHLYYEFMSDEDLKKYADILDDIFNDRLDIIENTISFNIANYYSKTKRFKRKLYILSFSFFGVRDKLKPIDEYIKEIKDSEQYKIFTSECRCNNCMTYFVSDDDLINIKDEDGELKGCPKCNTDAYLMDLTSLK